MSKTLWHTIQIQVPKEMVELTKSGKVSVKKTLTKTLNISRSQKTPAIKLIPSNDNKPHIVNDGKEWNIDALNERMAKARAMRKKNANKNVFDPAIKKMVNLNKFEGNIIKRARELGKEKRSKNHNLREKFNALRQLITTPDEPQLRNKLISKHKDKLIQLKEQLDKVYPNEKDKFIVFKPPEGHQGLYFGKDQTKKILKFGDIRGNMPERKMKGLYDLRSYKPAADDIYKHIIEYYWKHAYEFMDPQETPTQDELQTISKLLYQMTKKYYVIRSVASNGNVKGADYFLWDIIDRITDDQYKIIMKIAYHDGKNKNHTLLYKACNMHKKKLEDDEKEEHKRREEHKQKRAKMTPKEKKREEAFFNKLSRNELIM